MLHLYDTRTRTAQDISPMDGKTLRFYCCGPTVYGPAHIGNFRTFVMQDVFRRVLELGGVPTTHIRNLTDVDDKTIRDSQKAGVSLAEFTAGWADLFHLRGRLRAVEEPQAGRRKQLLALSLGRRPPRLAPGMLRHDP